MNLATEKQLSLIDKLARERPQWCSDHDFKPETIATEVSGCSIAVASSLIDALIKLPREDLPRGDGLPLDQIEIGSYWTLDGGVARVRQSKSSGYLFAEVLNKDIGGFIYTKGAIYKLKKRMTLDEAKAWGAQHGLCCVCGRMLTDNKSVAAGIGPVCAKRV